MTSTARLQCKVCGSVWDGDAILEFERHEAACKGKNSKSPKGYLAILGLLHDVALQHGYAMGVHGTLGRDLDLICVPWIESVSRPETLIEAMAHVAGGKVPVMFQAGGRLFDNPVSRPHGRQSWVVHLGGGAYLDVSVMPPNY